MSNTALAVAGLGVPYVAPEVKSLAIRVVNGPGVNSQDLCNLAWSLALLDMNMFELILDTWELHVKHAFGIRGVRQLYQAHCYLEPLSKNSEEYAA